MKITLFTFVFISFLAISIQAQEKKLSTKFNFGMSFSSPSDELGTEAVKGDQLQATLSLELAYHINVLNRSKYGIKIGAVVGQDWANFLSNNRVSEFNINVPSIKARLYPLSYQGNAEDAFEEIAPLGLPFLIEMPIWIGIYSCINSLHFDYGFGHGLFLETSFLDDENFIDKSLNRKMTYTGWGIQPQLYHSESGKWTWNGVFDFGKYSWINANGNISSFKSNIVGFGVQYNFL